MQFMLVSWKGGSLIYGQLLGIIFSVVSEQSGEGVVIGNDEISKVGEELVIKVEDDEEEVQCISVDYCVGFGDVRLFFEVVDSRVFGEFRIEYIQVVLGFFIGGCYFEIRQLFGCELEMLLSEVEDVMDWSFEVIN